MSLSLDIMPKASELLCSACAQARQKHGLDVTKGLKAICAVDGKGFCGFHLGAFVEAVR